MPLFFKKSFKDNTHIGVWKIEENINFFKSKLDLFSQEKKEIETLNKRKIMEWMASRYLLHLLLGHKDRLPSLKDQYGKPYIEGSALHMSISHSKDLISVIISTKNVGIDIQYFVQKIGRIEHKFVSPKESKLLTHKDRLNILHCIWGAKECLYKAHGRRGVSLLNDISISDLDYNEKGMQFTGVLNKNEVVKTFDCTYIALDNSTLIYAVQND